MILLMILKNTCNGSFIRHTYFLWYVDGNEQLPEKIVKIINDKANRCFVSIASIWEIVIKLSIQKLEIKGGFRTIENFLDNNDFEILPIDLDDTKTLLKLDFFSS